VLLITRAEEENDLTTRLRFIFLLAVHGLIFITMIVIIRIEQVYHLMVVIFILLLLVSVGLYICEVNVQLISYSKGYTYNHYANHLEKLELTYLNIYFLIYMYSLIGLIPSGLFLVSTEGLMCWQEYLINKYKGRCLRRILFRESLKYSECSICLVEFSAEDTDGLMEIISCGHIFHENCLCEWLRYNTKCPMDRGDIFVFNDEPQ
jgi:hypothetical protein